MSLASPARTTNGAKGVAAAVTYCCQPRAPSSTGMTSASSTRNGGGEGRWRQAGRKKGRGGGEEREREGGGGKQEAPAGTDPRAALSPAADLDPPRRALVALSACHSSPQQSVLRPSWAAVPSQAPASARPCCSASKLEVVQEF